MLDESKQSLRSSWAFALLGLFLMSLNSPILASSNLVSVDDSAVGATTTYTVSFKAVEPIDSGGPVPDSIIFETNGGADFSAASFNSISGGSGLVATVFSTSSNSIRLDITAGAAAPGDVVTLEFSNVVNPPSVGVGPDFTLRQVNFNDLVPTIIDITLPGVTYTSSNLPVVVNPIGDLIGEADGLVEGDPAFEAASDLNAVFDDADMDPLTFSLDPGTDTSVATATITGDDRLLVTPVGSGSTTVSVRATSVDGFAVDSFEVQVIGLIDDAVMTPSVLSTGETTSYVLTFNTAGALSAGQNVLVITGAGGPDYSGASLSVSGGSLVGSLPSPSDQAFRVSIDGGAAAAGTPITITLDNVINPASAGLGPDYAIRVTDGALQLIDRGLASGNVFEAGGAPFVVDPIEDQSLNEIDGPSTIVADIGTVFDEDDGDPVSYSVLPGNDPLVATAALIDNALVVTPTGPGDTTVTVEASDVDGSITDSFDITVVGIMDNAAFAPANNATGVLTNYSFSFTTSTALDDGLVLIVRNLGTGGPDFSKAELLEFSGGSLAMDFNAGDDTQVSIAIAGGSTNVGDTVSFTLGNVLNPDLAGPGPDYESEVFRLAGGTTVEAAQISGSDFVAPVDPVFDDRFEAIELR